MIAYETIKLNKDATERVAERLIAEGEMYGDDVTQMLDEAAPAEARNRRPGRVLMARDLIPPPSPAGRPTTPDGTPNLIELPPEPDAARTPEPAQRRRRPGRRSSATASASCSARSRACSSPSRWSRRSSSPTSSGDAGADEGLAANWSRWQPSRHDDRGRRARRSPSTSAPEYTHPDGKQLVQIKGARAAATIPIDAAPVQRADHRHRRHRVLYSLDGLGENGSIKGGTPSDDAAEGHPPRGARARALHVPLPARRGVGDDAAAAAAADRGGEAGRRARRRAPASRRRAHADRRRSSTARATSSRSCRCRSGRRSAPKAPSTDDVQRAPRRTPSRR